MKITFEIEDNPHELEQADNLTQKVKEEIIIDALSEGFNVDKEFIKIIKIEWGDINVLDI